MIEILHGILLGILQGITEFIPVSSSGHLVLGIEFLNFPRPDIGFEIFLHFGSLIAVLLYFRQDLISLCDSVIHFRDKTASRVRSRLIVLYLILATIVTGVIYMLFGDYFEAAFSSIPFVIAMLCVTGLILFFSDKIKSKNIESADLGVKRSIMIGLGQSLAMFPGISRSGTTIASGILVGLNRAEAARFSFLLMIPAIGGANLVNIIKISSIERNMYLPYILGMIAAFISGYLVIALLIRMIKKKQLKYFAYYCWTIALLSFIYFVL
jgi:undecaprenyl-diphosphatase